MMRLSRNAEMESGVAQDVPCSGSVRVPREIGTVNIFQWPLTTTHRFSCGTDKLLWLISFLRS